MMNQKQQLQQCISDCQQTVKELHSLADESKDVKLKSCLSESAHHLDMCLHECDYASKQAP